MTRDLGKEDNLVHFHGFIREPFLSVVNIAASNKIKLN